MAKLGAAVAIIRDNTILLIQREDVGAWSLPGGIVEKGEAVAEAAIRETKEETGFDVELTHIVGVYAMPQTPDDRDDHMMIFAGRIIGGTLLKSTSETLDAQFFTLQTLPENILWHYKIRIHDALSGVSGVFRTQIITSDTPYLSLSRAELYAKLRSGEITHADVAQAMQELNGKVITHVGEPTETEKPADDI